jgi:hypothetical protein
VDNIAIEYMLAHKVKDDVIIIYRRKQTVSD